MLCGGRCLGGAFLARRFGTLRRARSERRFTVNRATTATEWDWEWSRRLAYRREGCAHGGTGGRCGGRGSVSTCVAISGSGECARQRFVPSRAHGFWLGGALFLVHPSVQKQLGHSSPSSSQRQLASDARTCVEVGDTAVAVGRRSLSSSLHGRRPNSAEELRSAVGQGICARRTSYMAELLQVVRCHKCRAPIPSSVAKMWSESSGPGSKRTNHVRKERKKAERKQAKQGRRVGDSPRYRPAFLKSWLAG